MTRLFHFSEQPDHALRVDRISHTHTEVARMSHTVLLTPAQVAAAIGLSRSTLAKLRLTGGGPPFRKLGSRVLYPQVALEEWIGSRPVFLSTSEYTTGRVRSA
jgi:predicted DNA-binding transcriptional regulator AlpA